MLVPLVVRLGIHRYDEMHSLTILHLRQRSIRLSVAYGVLVATSVDVVASGDVVVDESSGEVSDGIGSVDVDDAPSTAGVEGEVTNGNDLAIYVPLDWSAYCPSSRSPLAVS